MNEKKKNNNNNNNNNNKGIEERNELEVKSLVKAVVPPTLILNPSPANLQSTRLALHVNNNNEDDKSSSSTCVYIASHSHVYKLQIPLTTPDCGSLINEGKESLLIPQHIHPTEDPVQLNRCPHRSQIQTITLAQSDTNDYLVLGTVDSYGHLIVSKLDLSGQDIDSLTYSVVPRDCGVGEGSWAGLCFSPSQWSMAVVARSFCKSIDIYDQDIHLRTLRTLWYPTSLNFIESLSNGNAGSVLAVSEGCQLSIWDIRMKENGGCVHRICGSPGDNIYAVSVAPNGNIAVGGAERSAIIYDPRRWASLSRWVSCSKYEITGLAFSSVNSDYLYVQGMDYEVFCGNWRDCKKSFSFRGDSNWLGFSKALYSLSPGRDVVGGWCDSGSIFVADVVAKWT